MKSTHEGINPISRESGGIESYGERVRDILGRQYKDYQKSVFLVLKNLDLEKAKRKLDHLEQMLGRYDRTHTDDDSVVFGNFNKFDFFRGEEISAWKNVVQGMDPINLQHKGEEEKTIQKQVDDSPLGTMH